MYYVALSLVMFVVVGSSLFIASDVMKLLQKFTGNIPFPANVLAYVLVFATCYNTVLAMLQHTH